MIEGVTGRTDPLPFSLASSSLCQGRCVLAASAAAIAAASLAAADRNHWNIGVPYRIRTGVAAVRGRCPGPLDEGDEAGAVSSSWPRRDQARAIPPAFALVAEIYVLQRLLDVHPAGDGDRGLQIVPLFAGDAQLVSLDRYLNLELAVLDFPDQLP